MKQLSGVRGRPLSVAHRERGTDRVHGHTYTVIAWFPFGENVLALREKVDAVLAPLDHSMLPDEIAWAEDLAAHLLIQLKGCVRIDINREAEGLFASAIRE